MRRLLDFLLSPLVRLIDARIARRDALALKAMSDAARLWDARQRAEVAWHRAKTASVSPGTSQRSPAGASAHAQPGA